MEQKQITATYAEAVKAIKEAILESRYRNHGDGSSNSLPRTIEQETETL